MRNLPPRPVLASSVQQKLKRETQRILQLSVGTDRQASARKIYNAARQRRWFQQVVDALRGLCGEGELCMYCSCNEPSQIEHYRPLAIFPERALEYENYLWSCDICNRAKGGRFPPDTETGAQILNPLEDSIWDHFFLDENFGRLIRRSDSTTGEPLPRAVSTCDVVGIDRENVQIKRARRFKSLRRDVEYALNGFRAGKITKGLLHDEIESLRCAPFQADVADYFLNGPGRKHEPFKSALVASGETVP